MNRTARVSLGLLDRIVATKVREVEILRQQSAELWRDARAVAPPVDFAAALRGVSAAVSVIAEVKRRSPSAGVLRDSADPATTAVAYSSGGASAISVLTDAEYFGGSIADVAAVVAAVPIPVLRKDFTIDALQIAEARASGAAAILLIVRLLDLAALTSLREEAEALGMAALVEAHDERELDLALRSGATIVGVNNRDLDTLTIDLAVSESLLPRIPANCLAIAESGIRDAADVARMAAAGADAVLVGESLMRHGPSKDGVQSLAGVLRRARP
ncbi:MAG: indole-3-glycerol phosphate synthase TrpC [Longimicrobiales bacterium]